MNRQFSEIVERGIEKIYSEDMESQLSFIKTVAEDVREVSADLLISMKAFFVPNNDYMIKYFGEGIQDYEYDCYWQGECVWQGYLIIPVTNINGRIVGFTGFNAYNRLVSIEENKWDLQYYRVSSDRLFNKSNYVFCPNGVIQKAIKDGYIVITDGNFDMLSLNMYGINAGALLGSYLSEVIIAQLLFIDKIYVSCDNDEAGVKLVQRMKKKLNNVYYLKQNGFKDIDDLLKSKYRDRFLTEFKKVLENRFIYDYTFHI